MSRLNRRTVLALGGLVGIIVTLHLASRVGLRGPTGMSGTELGDWLDDPVTAAATVARWLALALSYYLLVAVTAVAFLPPPSHDASASTETPAGIRRLIPPGLASAIGVALGVGIPLSSAATFALTTDAPLTAPTQRLRLVEAESPLTLQPHVPDNVRPSDGPHHLHLVSPAENEPSNSTTDVWVTQSGDSMWAIAEETLLDRAAPGEEIPEETIAAYWRVLIDTNRNRFIEPGNPDLIMPGQEFVLPPIARGNAEDVN